MVEAQNRDFLSRCFTAIHQTRCLKQKALEYLHHVVLHSKPSKFLAFATPSLPSVLYLWVAFRIFHSREKKSDLSAVTLSTFLSISSMCIHHHQEGQYMRATKIRKAKRHLTMEHEEWLWSDAETSRRQGQYLRRHSNVSFHPCTMLIQDVLNRY